MSSPFKTLTPNLKSKTPLKNQPKSPIKSSTPYYANNMNINASI